MITPRQQWEYTSVFGRNKDHDCMRAALVNALKILTIMTRKNSSSLGPTSDDRFGTASPRLEKNLKPYAIFHFSVRTLRADDYVMQQTDGVFPLTIAGADPV